MRLSIAALVVLLIFSLALARYSQSEALGAVDSWVDYRNPHFSALQQIGRPQISAQPLARHLVIILLDGLSKEALLYHAERNESVKLMISRGALYLGGRTAMPSYSYPTRATMLTGAPPEIHEVSSNFFKGEIRVDNLMKVARDSGYSVIAVGDSGIHKLFASQLTVSFPMDRGASQAAVAAERAIELFSSHAARGERVFLWLGITDVDTMGHKAGPYTSEYNETVVNVASVVNRFLDEMSRRGLAKDSLVVIVNDHGFKRGGHHGGPEREVVEHYMIIVSELARPGRYEISFDQRDLAPTIAMLMGWPLPALSTGSPITAGLALPDERASRYAEAARAQGMTVMRTVANSMGLSLSSPEPKGAFSEIAMKGARPSAGSMVAGIIMIALPIALAAAALYIYSRSFGAPSLFFPLVLAVLIELSFWGLYSFQGRPSGLSDVYSFSGLLSQIRASLLFAGIIAGATVGLSELFGERRGLLWSAWTVLAAFTLFAAISYIVPAFFIATYGSDITMPFPDWGNAFYYFFFLIRHAFSLLALPLSLAIALALSLVARLKAP